MTTATVRHDWAAAAAAAPTPAPTYLETLQWTHTRTALPSHDVDVLVTFSDTPGAYLAALMPEGWIGTDGDPLDGVSWWAPVPPGPPPAFTRAIPTQSETGVSSTVTK